MYHHNHFLIYICVLWIDIFIYITCVIGRPEPESTSEDGHANATMAVSSLDESKLTIKFCVIRDCQTKGVYYGFVGCYCCFSLKGVPCYDTVDECQKICPAQST